MNVTTNGEDNEKPLAESQTQSQSQSSLEMDNIYLKKYEEAKEKIFKNKNMEL